MKSMAFGVQFGHLIVSNFSTVLIGRFIQPAMDFQSLDRSCRANQVDDHLMALQRYATPVPRDVAEQSMLDLVPLARSRWIVANLDDQTGLVGQPLQFMLPQPVAVAVAAATVSGD